MESLLSETARQRANRDTISAFRTLRFWLFDLCAGAIFTIVVLIWTPSWASNELKIIYQVLVPVFVVVIGLAVLYFASLIKAPYLQRNEARRAFENLSQTPLVVECNSFEYYLAGKNWLQENQYIWWFNVILTNNSDKDNVGTKAISLLVNYSTPDGKVKSYDLSLVLETDRDKYGRSSMARGRLLVENEYLRPHESLTGFYQFLDTEAFWKPKLIQTWPTLVVVDSLGAPHRKQFNRSHFAALLDSDKKDSQTK